MEVRKTRTEFETAAVYCCDFFFGVDVYEVESWVRTWPGELCIGSVLVAVCRIGGASMETLAGGFYFLSGNWSEFVLDAAAHGFIS